MSGRPRRKRRRPTRTKAPPRMRPATVLRTTARVLGAVAWFFLGTAKRTMALAVSLATILGLYWTAYISTADILPLHLRGRPGELRDAASITATGPFALHDLRTACIATSTFMLDAPPDVRSGCDKLLNTPDWDKAAKRNMMVELKSHGTISPAESQVKHVCRGFTVGMVGPNSGFALAAEFETSILWFYRWRRRVCREFEILMDANGQRRFVPRGPNEFPPWANE